MLFGVDDVPKEMGHWFKSEAPHRGGAERLARPHFRSTCKRGKDSAPSTGEVRPGLTHLTLVI